MGSLFIITNASDSFADLAGLLLWNVNIGVFVLGIGSRMGAAALAGGIFVLLGGFLPHLHIDSCFQKLVIFA